MEKSCLFIDDDEEDFFLFETAIQEIDSSIQCWHETDCKSAIEQLSDEAGSKPGLIFLDLNMPGMDGRVCLSELKKLERLSEVPIVIFSTSDNTQDVNATKNLGATGYVVKAPNFKVMKELLAKAIRAVEQKPRTHFFYGYYSK